MLSSSSLRKNKEVLAWNGGGEIWERIVSKLVFCGRVAFEHDTLSLALCLCWKIHLSLDHTPIRLQIGLWSLLLSQYFQDSCRVVNMFKEKFNPESLLLRRPFLQSLKPSIVSAIPESVLNHLLLWSTSNLVTCFMSLMWDTLRPSCDESFPVDFNSLSRN